MLLNKESFARRRKRRRLSKSLIIVQNISGAWRVSTFLREKSGAIASYCASRSIVRRYSSQPALLRFAATPSFSDFSPFAKLSAKRRSVDMFSAARQTLIALSSATNGAPASGEGPFSTPPTLPRGAHNPIRPMIRLVFNHAALRGLAGCRLECQIILRFGHGKEAVSPQEHLRGLGASSAGARCSRRRRDASPHARGSEREVAVCRRRRGASVDEQRG